MHTIPMEDTDGDHAAADITTYVRVVVDAADVDAVMTDGRLDPYAVTQLSDDIARTMSHRPNAVCDEIDITLPDDLTAIDDGAGLADMDPLSGTMYSSMHGRMRVRVHVNDTLTRIGSGAFGGCAVDRMPPAVRSIGENAFVGNGSIWGSSDAVGSGGVLTLPATLGAMGPGAFMWRDTYDAIEWPVCDGVRELAHDTFAHCAGIGYAMLPEGILAIGRKAFTGCTRLKTVTLPSTLERVGDCAFAGCTELREAGLEGTRVRRIGESAFERCGRLGTMTLPGTLESIGPGAFRRCERLTGIDLPEGIRTVDNSTFEGCRKLKHVTLPASLESIGVLAFSGTGLASVRIPRTTARIRQEAFRGCTSLASVTMHEGLESIGVRAFTDCTRLERIDIPASVTSIGDGAFGGTALTALLLPEKTATIGRVGSGGCIGNTGVPVESIVMPADASMPSHALDGFDRLRDVVPPMARTDHFVMTTLRDQAERHGRIRVHRRADLMRRTLGKEHA